MDARFDALAIGLAGAVSRRETLRWVGAFVAGALLGPLGNRLAWGQDKDECFDFCDEIIDRKEDPRSRVLCRLNCQKCKRNNGTVCARRFPLKGFETPTVCVSPASSLVRCRDGRCCSVDEECCGSPTGSVCCKPTEVCFGGLCEPCPAGRVACRGQGDPVSDPFSQCCGLGNEFCDAETQRCVACDPGIVNCDGRCCAPGEVCDQDQCAAPPDCGPGSTLCGAQFYPYSVCCPEPGTILTKCCASQFPPYCERPDYICCDPPNVRCNPAGTAGLLGCCPPRNELTETTGS